LSTLEATTIALLVDERVAVAMDITALLKKAVTIAVRLVDRDFGPGYLAQLSTLEATMIAL
jgi:hypothetical protein